MVFIFMFMLRKNSRCVWGTGLYEECQGYRTQSFFQPVKNSTDGSFGTLV